MGVKLAIDKAISSLIYCTIPLWGTLLSVLFLKDKFFVNRRVFSGPHGSSGISTNS